MVVHTLQSEVLKDNPLGDPSERDVAVYLPPGYDDALDAKSGRRFPALLGVVGFTGTGSMLFNIDPLGEDLKRKLDRMILVGDCPPVIVAAPDCFTRVGGNQYINSTATGRYEDFLLQEAIPLVSKEHAITRWGVFGKSSGGYGSMMLGMRHPDVFSALADHSGDACFELCYLHDFPAALDAFRDHGGPAGWLEAYWKDKNRRRNKHFKPLTVLGMAAHYSPNPASPHLGIDFPFDLDTGEFRWEIWQRWRACDPVNLVEAYAEVLRRMKLVYLDCGTRDEYALIWGARALDRKLTQAGVTHHYEEFDDGHMNITYRYDVSIPMLARALSEG